MATIKLKAPSGGSVSLVAGDTASDVVFTIPPTTSTIVTSDVLAAPTGSGLVGYMPAGGVARDVESKLREGVSVKDFGAVGDGVVDDYAAIQAAVNLGGRVYLPSGVYLTSAPIEILSYVEFVGEDQNVIIKKSNTSTLGGIDCVVYAKDRNRFAIKNIRVEGNRVRDTGTGVVTVSSHGFYIQGCSFFEMTGTRARQCLHGYYIKTCWSSSINKSTAQQCQSYGYKFETSCTSLVVNNPVAWGCGGGFSLYQCVYMQINSPACDHSDAGKKSDDPFLPEGSGGDYQNTAYIFSIVASQGITINSPGTENSYSQYLYAEGAFVTIVSPYFYNLQCFDPTWNFIATRQTGNCQVVIINPYGTLSGVLNTLSVSSTVRGLYVETPATQVINILGDMQIGTSFGTYAYSVVGVNFSTKVKLLDLTQQSMQIGASAPFIKPNTDVCSVSLSGTTKILTVDSVTANVVNFDLPLISGARYFIKATGTYSSSYDTAKIQVIEFNGVTTNVLDSWTNSSGSISISDWFSFVPTSGYSLFLRIKTNHTTDVMTYSNLELVQVTDV